MAKVWHTVTSTLCTLYFCNRDSFHSILQGAISLNSGKKNDKV